MAPDWRKLPGPHRQVPGRRAFTGFEPYLALALLLVLFVGFVYERFAPDVTAAGAAALFAASVRAFSMPRMRSVLSRERHDARRQCQGLISPEERRSGARTGRRI
jgi:hypothetical protein